MLGTQYNTTPGGVFSLNYHLVWYPKYRRKVLEGNVAVCIKELLSEKAYQLDADIEGLEIMPDHFDLFVSSDPTKALQYLANQFKGYTSWVIQQEFAHLRNRTSALWRRSYYVSRVGHVFEETARRTIEIQENHS